MKKIGFIIGLMMMASVLVAQSVKDAEYIVTSQVQSVTQYLKTSTENMTAKKARLRVQLEPFFDFELITKLTVGRQYWTSLTTAQQTQFVNQFKTYLVTLYLDYLDSFSTQIITFNDTRAVGKTKAVVPMLIQDGDALYHLDYKMYAKNKTWKVYDLDIEGVSIIRTYRAQFAPFLAKGQFEELLKRIQ